MCCKKSSNSKILESVEKVLRLMISKLEFYVFQKQRGRLWRKLNLDKTPSLRLS